ncbi:MAG: hypothetical protein PHV59_11115 [Victivallales bacterium]|nr:hypothetical protein [Victivallales bacterium]
MKRISVLMILAALFITTATIDAKNSSEKKPSKKSKKVNEARAAKYKKYAQEYLEKAKKAEAAGQTELAALYNECAQNAAIMAECTSRSEFKAAQSKLRENLREIKKLEKSSSKDKKDSSDSETPSAAMAEKHKKYADDYTRKAAKYKGEGNTQKAEYYTRLAAARRKIADAYAKNDMAAVKEAEKEFENIKKGTK